MTEHHPLILSPQEHTHKDHPRLDTPHTTLHHDLPDTDGVKHHKTVMTVVLVAILQGVALILIQLPVTELQKSDHHFHATKLALRLPTTLVLPETISGILPSP